MRTALDAMGGDFAPAELVKGTVEALDILADDDQVVLVGDREAIAAELDRFGGPLDRIEIAHASQVINMDEAPVEALRKKPDSSIRRMVDLMVAGEVDAVLSAGNTGAVVAAAQMGARALKGVRRPGISVTVPTYYGPVVLIDVGANINARPMHLVQYGVMASVYSNRVLGIESPRVGLLSIGSEEGKGTNLVHETRELMRKAPLNFRGNAEGRDVFAGTFDVIVCDGFVGNVMLKVVESMAEGLFKTLAHELTRAVPELVPQLEPHLGELRDQHNYSAHGGAPLLGIDGICVIAHGSSDARAIKNALKAASQYAHHGTNEAIEAALAPTGEVRT